MLADGRPVWERTAELIAGWGEPFVGESGLSAVGAVVGATWPEAVVRARDLMPHQPLLLPGVGAQGGAAGDLHAAFRDHPAGGLVVAARSVIYAWRERGGDWQQGVQHRRGRTSAAPRSRCDRRLGGRPRPRKGAGRAGRRRGAPALPPHPAADAEARRELGHRGRPRRRGRDPRAAGRGPARRRRARRGGRPHRDHGGPARPGARTLGDRPDRLDPQLHGRHPALGHARRPAGRRPAPCSACATYRRWGRPTRPPTASAPA